MGSGRRTPRQTDIARIAGVSQATVSVVLGGNRTGVRLSERTRLRVLEAAEKLGYVPDPIATRLASSRNNLIGVYRFTPAAPADAYHPILAGIETEAEALGKDLIMFTASSAERDHLGIRRTRLADGCLFLGRDVPVAPVRALAASGFRIVYIGHQPELGDDIPYVDGDYVTASANVVTQLVRAGHRRIRYLCTSASDDRAQGVLAGAARHGLDPCGLVVPTGEATPRTWADEGVTALIVTSALYSDVDGALRSASLSVPGDFSLAVLGTPGPEVSGFEVPRQAIGREAVRLLVTLLDSDEDLPAPHRLLPCRPVPGETIAEIPLRP